MKRYASVVVEQMSDWIGRNEYDGTHKEIIDIYNAQRILPRGYKVKYTDAWCATTVSAAFIVSGCSALIPMECSCGKMIETAKIMGIFQENDGYVASPGDLLLYDFDDNGVGDCKGWPDHIGVVEYVSGGKIVVIEGNYRNAVNRRQIDVDGKYIRGFICPRYDVEEKLSEDEKSLEDIAREVIRGKWGNGSERKKRLEAAGYSYKEVQAMVNKLIR